MSNRLLTNQTTLPAKQIAIEARGGKVQPGIIFHSNGGGQYYADEFLSLTQEQGFKNSMCKHAYENGKVEIVNGVIKNNYLKHWGINSLSDFVKGADRAVNLYNTDKPHSSLQRMTPIEYENKFCTLRHESLEDRILQGKKQSYQVKSII